MKSQMYDQIPRKLEMLGHLKFCQQVALLSLFTKYILAKKRNIVSTSLLLSSSSDFFSHIQTFLLSSLLQRFSLQ